MFRSDAVDRAYSAAVDEAYGGDGIAKNQRTDFGLNLDK